jgi:hypothetical protein
MYKQNEWLYFFIVLLLIVSVSKSEISRHKYSHFILLLFLFTLGGNRFGSNRRTICILGISSGMIIFEKYEVNYCLYKRTPSVSFRVVACDEKQL